MIRRSNKKHAQYNQAPFNGKGEVYARNILNGPEELSEKGRAFTHNTLKPGTEIGYHIHKGESETYYILSGHGIYNDNGNKVEVGPGDVTRCAPGEGHGLACTGAEPLDMIALILYE